MSTACRTSSLSSPTPQCSWRWRMRPILWGTCRRRYACRRRCGGLAWCDSARCTETLPNRWLLTPRPSTVGQTSLSGTRRRTETTSRCRRAGWYLWAAAGRTASLRVRWRTRCVRWLRAQVAHGVIARLAGDDTGDGFVMRLHRLNREPAGSGGDGGAGADAGAGATVDTGEFTLCPALPPAGTDTRARFPCHAHTYSWWWRWWWWWYCGLGRSSAQQGDGLWAASC